MDGPFTQVPNGVLNDTELSGYAQLMYVQLAKYAGPSGDCFPSFARLMQATSLSRATVYRALQQLAQRGWISRKRTGRADLYHLMPQTDTSPSPLTEASESSHRDDRLTQRPLSPLTEVQNKNQEQEVRSTPRPRKQETKEREGNSLTVAAAPPSKRRRKIPAQNFSLPLGPPTVEIPPAFVEFDAALRQAPGYQPTAKLFEKLAPFATSRLDLELEALSIADWLALPKQRKTGQTASLARIVKWLKRSLDETPTPQPPSPKRTFRSSDFGQQRDGQEELITQAARYGIPT